MEVSVLAVSSKSSRDFTATTILMDTSTNQMQLCSRHRPLVDLWQDRSHGNLQNHTTALFKRCPLVESCQVWNSLRIPLWETHVEPTSQMNAPCLEDIQPTFVVHGLSPLQSKISRDKMSEIITGHIKTMKLSTVLMVSSLLLKAGSWNYIHNHSGEESHSNAHILVWVKQSISSLMNRHSPLGKDCHIS